MTTDEGEAIDMEITLQRVGGSQETVMELGELLLEQADPLMETIRDAVAQRAASELRHAAHTLKGSVDVFDAKRAVRAAYRLEVMGRDEDFDGAEEALEELEQAFDAVVRALRARLQTEK